MDYVQMGRRIRKCRHIVNMTQEALAERADLSVSFVGCIERGTRKASLDSIAKICDVFDISLDEIVLGILPVFRSEDILVDINRMVDLWDTE